MKIIAIVFIVFLASCSNEVRTGYVTIRGTKIYYEEDGKGIPLVLLSGGGINRSVRDFDKCIPKLSSKFRVILPDSPGQGKSEQPDTLTYEILTDFFSQFIDSLHLDSVYVMGWSDGGIAALLLAERKSDQVKKIIAVGANSGLKGALPAGIDVSLVQPQPLEVWAKNNKHAIDDYDKDLKRDWRNMMNSFNRMWYQEMYFDESILTRIKIPVMIAQGDNDDIIVDHAVGLHRFNSE